MHHDWTGKYPIPNLNDIQAKAYRHGKCVTSERLLTYSRIVHMDEISVQSQSISVSLDFRIPLRAHRFAPIRFLKLSPCTLISRLPARPNRSESEDGRTPQA